MNREERDRHEDRNCRGGRTRGAGLPLRVQGALGELVRSAKEGLLALSVCVGLGVLAELMEEDVDEVVGVEGKHIPEPTARRVMAARVAR